MLFYLTLYRQRLPIITIPNEFVCNTKLLRFAWEYPILQLQREGRKLPINNYAGYTSLVYFIG